MFQNVDVVIVGAGFAGLRALHSFRGMGLSCVVLEAASAIGGVWQYNGYPGARCDVESYDYSYRFSPELEQDWRWSERYATQPEILRYINHVADRFDLRRDVRLNTRVARAAWDKHSARWTITAEDGQAWSCTRLVLAVGQLSTPKDTVYPGQETFDGEVIYSARWPKQPVDFTGKRVGIIGTGSSGVQMTPVIAAQAAHLSVFQRTPNFSIPAANAPLTDEEDRTVKADYRSRRDAARNSPNGLGFIPDTRSATDVPEQEREIAFETAWNRLGFGFALTFRDIITDEASNDTASDFIRRKIAGQVADPVTREKLTPRGFPFATRRPSVDSGYFATFNRPNVSLVDIAEHPIVSITPAGIRTAEKEHPLDVIIYATGFDAFTGSLLKPEIVGVDGMTLREAWQAGPRSFLGLCVHGFPNMFVIVGPGSPSLLSNVLLSTEEQIDWLVDLFAWCRDHAIATVEATAQAQDDWANTLNEQAQKTLYPRAASFYIGAEMPGKPRVFMPYSGGVQRYRGVLNTVAANGYAGLKLGDNRTVDA